MSTDLIAAAKDRDISKIKWCLSQGHPINFCDINGRTALIWAASFGFVDGVEYLLSQNASCHCRSKQNETAFTAAIIYGHINVVQCFVQKNKISHQDLTEGFFAAIHIGNLKIVKYLYHLNPKALITAVDEEGNGAFHLAILHSHPNILDFLIGQASEFVFNQKNHSNLDGYGLAVKQNNLLLAKKLLQSGCYVDMSIFSERIPHTQIRRLYNSANRLFRVLDSKKQTEFLKLLEILGDGVNGRRFFDGNTALHVAVLQGQVSAVHALMYYHANLDIHNKSKESPYLLAIHHRDLLMQASGHFFKTIQLLKKQIHLATFKPLTAKPLTPVHQKMENDEFKETVEHKTMAEQFTVDAAPMAHPILQDTSKENGQLELEITIQMLNQLDQKDTYANDERRRLIAYMFFELGKALVETNPKLAFQLLQNVRQISKVHFARAHAKIYYLIKYNKINLKIPTDMEPDQYRTYILIREMLFAKLYQDQDGISIQSHIQNYTKESLENIQKLQAISDTVSLDSVAIKQDFMQFLSFLREKNLHTQTLLLEISRLKNEISALNTSNTSNTMSASNISMREETTLTNATPLKSVPELSPVIISDYYSPGATSPRKRPPALQVPFSTPIHTPSCSPPGTPIRIRSPLLEQQETLSAPIPRHPGTPSAATFHQPLIFHKRPATTTNLHKLALSKAAASSQPTLQMHTLKMNTELHSRSHSVSLTNLQAPARGIPLSITSAENLNQMLREPPYVAASGIARSDPGPQAKKALSFDDAPDAAPIAVLNATPRASVLC